MWTLRARTKTAAQVRRGGLRGLSIPGAPPAGEDLEGLVRWVLGVTRARCLVRSLVLQRYLSGQGVLVDVVVGATAPRQGFSAHAWLDRDADDRGHVELLRLGPAGERTRP